jgi:hypothetical protein
MDGTLTRQPPLVETHIRFPPETVSVQGLDKKSCRDERVRTSPVELFVS